jgi:hypothetical protein
LYDRRETGPPVVLLLGALDRDRLVRRVYCLDRIAAHEQAS